MTSRLPGLVRWFSYKDWLDMSRNPRAWINLMQPLIMVVVVVGPLLGTRADPRVTQIISFWSLIVFLLMFLSTIPLGLPVMSLVEEGRRLALLRSLPVPMGSVLRAKAWNTWLPLMAAWTLVLVLTAVLLKHSGWQFAFLIGLTTWCLSMNLIIGLAVGALTIDFSVEDLKKRFKGWAGYFIMGLCFVYSSLSMGIGVWISLRLVDDPGLLLVMGVFRDMGWIPWMWSGSGWPLLGMVSGIILFWLAVILSWRWAVRRLERWEPV